MHSDFLVIEVSRVEYCSSLIAYKLFASGVVPVH